MKSYSRYLFFVVALVASLQMSAQVLDPVKWSFAVANVKDDQADLIFTATIDKSWHLYSTDIPQGGPIPTSFHLTANNNYQLVGGIVEPKAMKSYDANFGMELKYFAEKAVFVQKIKFQNASSFAIQGTLEFMCCDDKSCLPPKEVDFTFDINVNNTQQAEVVSVEDVGGEGKSLWMFFFIAFVAGLLGVITPCVFPMIPMTVTYFLSQVDSKKIKWQAIVYGLSIILIYTLFGLIISIFLGPDFLNWLSTHWIPNLLFFLLFVLFAASFFGLYEIVLPGKLINQSDQRAEKGGMIGAFFMALTLVLVSFSCTAPIIGALLIEAATGAVLRPVVGMLGFSLAFALPFTLLAFFPSWLRSLPKSGGWLTEVKIVLGFIVLALSMKFIMIPDQTYHWGLLDRDVFLLIWIVLFIILGLYILGIVRFKHDQKIKRVNVLRIFFAAIAFAFVAYLASGLFGEPLKAISGILPPQKEKALFESQKIIDKTGNLCETPLHGEFLKLPHDLLGYFDYKQGMACAKKLNKPVFLDFNGHGCSKCKEMEAKVWSDLRVLKILQEQYVIIALYVDDKTELPSSEWVTSSYDGKVKKTMGKINADFQISHFNANAQPYYVLLDTSENVINVPKMYDLDIDQFLVFLEEGVRAFYKGK